MDEQLINWLNPDSIRIIIFLFRGKTKDNTTRKTFELVQCNYWGDSVEFFTDAMNLLVILY